MKENTQELHNFFAKKHETLTKWRQHLHQYPEVGFTEVETSAFIAEILQNMGLSADQGIGGTGLVATLEGDRPGPTVGLRADMDALPILEQTGLPYASKYDGVAHSCGHDGHMVMLLGAAEYLAKTRNFPGTVRFIFQPAEEALGGALAMLKDGLLNKWPLNQVFAVHNWPGIPVGQMAVQPGAVMASSDLFRIELNASGSHAALPHQGTDAIVAAATMISSIQTITSRSVNTQHPLVVSVTQVHGGDAVNVLPHQVILKGTIRTLDNDTLQFTHQRLAAIVDSISSMYGIDCILSTEKAFPVTINTPNEAAFSKAVAGSLLGDENVITEYRPSMASEDFAYLLEEVPGSYAWVGNGRDVPLHHPEFDFNDDILPIGASYLASLVTNAGDLDRREKDALER